MGKIRFDEVDHLPSFVALIPPRRIVESKGIWKAYLTRFQKWVDYLTYILPLWISKTSDNGIVSGFEGTRSLFTLPDSEDPESTRKVAR